MLDRLVYRLVGERLELRRGLANLRGLTPWLRCAMRAPGGNVRGVGPAWIPGRASLAPGRLAFVARSGQGIRVDLEVQTVVETRATRTDAVDAGVRSHAVWQLRARDGAVLCSAPTALLRQAATLLRPTSR